MHKTIAAICMAIGILALPFVGFWSWFAAGFGAFDRNGLQILVLLVGGPLSVLPAGIVGRNRPLTAGAWLVGGAFFSFFWHLLVIMHDGFGQLLRINPSFEAWIPVTVICIPMLLLGSAFLWSGKDHAREVVLGWWKAPVFRRRLAIIGATLGSVAALWLVVAFLTRPVWTLSVTPEGGKTRSIRFDPRRLHPLTSEEHEKELGEVFSDLFRQAKPSGRTILGKSVWLGPESAGGTSVWTADRNSKGLLLIAQNETPIDHNWMYDEPALSNARRAAVRQILDQAWRDYPPSQR